MKALAVTILLTLLLATSGCEKPVPKKQSGPASPDTSAEAWAVEQDSTLVSMGFTQVAKGFIPTADTGFVIVHTVTKRHKESFLVYFDRAIGQRVGEALLPEDRTFGPIWLDEYQRGERSGIAFLASFNDHSVMFRVVPPDHPHALEMVMDRVSSQVRDMHIK